MPLTLFEYSKSGHARLWHEADELTEWKVRSERGADQTLPQREISLPDVKSLEWDCSFCRQNPLCCAKLLYRV